MSEIVVTSNSGGRIRTGEGGIARVVRGQTVFVRVGGEYPQGLAGGRRFRVSELVVAKITPTRIRLDRGNGRGAWRKHGEVFLTREAASN